MTPLGGRVAFGGMTAPGVMGLGMTALGRVGPRDFAEDWKPDV